MFQHVSGVLGVAQQLSPVSTSPGFCEFTKNALRSVAVDGSVNGTT